MEYKLQDAIKFYKDWLNIEPKKFGEILTKFPYLLDFPNSDYQKCVRVLL